jgi:hypothetical protein
MGTVFVLSETVLVLVLERGFAQPNMLLTTNSF